MPYANKNGESQFVCPRGLIITSVVRLLDSIILRLESYFESSLKSQLVRDAAEKLVFILSSWSEVLKLFG